MEQALTVALVGALTAVLLLIQTWAQERRRKIETEAAREKQAEANATRVVEKLTKAGAVDPDKTLDASLEEKKS